MRYLRLLFWLKWKLMWRSYQRNTTAVVGVILSLIVFLPLSLGIALACTLGFLALDPPNNEHLLRAVLLGIYIFWALSPLIGYALNDSYDITRLFVYPVSIRQIFSGAIIGSFVDFPVLLLLPTLIGVMVGFSHGPAVCALVCLAVGLFLFHTLSLSQALIMASAGVLRSRRFRDVVMVLIPLLWMAYYILQQTLSRRAVHVDWNVFLNSRAWDLLNLLPPGLAARAVGAAGQDEMLLALEFLAGLAVYAVLTIYLAAWLIQAIYAGEEVGPRRKQAAAREKTPLPRARAASRPIFGLRLPPVVEAVAEKEAKYFVRHPYFKIALMNLVYMLFVGVFMFWQRAGQEATAGVFNAAATWGASGLLLLSEMQLLFNMFGTDGDAAALLFLFPASRRQILLGKNLPLFLVLSGVNTLFLFILALLAGALAMYGPLLCWMELALVVFLAIGNLTSIWMPYRVVAQGWRMRPRSTGQGCGYGFLYMAVALAAFTLLLPVLAALLLPAFELISPVWFALTIPLAALYAFGLYALALRRAEPLLIEREVGILERVGQPD